MANPFSLLDRSRIHLDVKVTSRRQLFQHLAHSVTETLTGISDAAVVDMLSQREKLGSTGIGSGIAIPHAKLSEIRIPVGAFTRLAPSLDFDAIDDQPVDLVFMILAPAESEVDHLKSLSRIARVLRRHDVCEQLRYVQDVDQIEAIFAAHSKSEAA